MSIRECIRECIREYIRDCVARLRRRTDSGRCPPPPGERFAEARRLPACGSPAAAV